MIVNLFCDMRVKRKYLIATTIQWPSSNEEIEIAKSLEVQWLCSIGHDIALVNY